VNTWHAWRKAQFTHRFGCENEVGDQLEEVEIHEDNIKVGIKEVGWEGVDNSSGVAQGEVVIVNTVTNLWVS
jgi:hypothetical protein